MATWPVSYSKSSRTAERRESRIVKTTDLSLLQRDFSLPILFLFFCFKVTGSWWEESTIITNKNARKENQSGNRFIFLLVPSLYSFIILIFTTWIRRRRHRTKNLEKAPCPLYRNDITGISISFYRHSYSRYYNSYGRPLTTTRPSRYGPATLFFFSSLLFFSIRVHVEISREKTIKRTFLF